MMFLSPLSHPLTTDVPIKDEDFPRLSLSPSRLEGATVPTLSLLPLQSSSCNNKDGTTTTTTTPTTTTTTNNNTNNLLTDNKAAIATATTAATLTPITTTSTTTPVATVARLLTPSPNTSCTTNTPTSSTKTTPSPRTPNYKVIGQALRNIFPPPSSSKPATMAAPVATPNPPSSSPVTTAPSPSLSNISPTKGPGLVHQQPARQRIPATRPKAKLFLKRNDPTVKKYIPRDRNGTPLNLKDSHLEDPGTSGSVKERIKASDDMRYMTRVNKQKRDLRTIDEIQRDLHANQKRRRSQEGEHQTENPPPKRPSYVPEAPKGPERVLLPDLPDIGPNGRVRPSSIPRASRPQASARASTSAPSANPRPSSSSGGRRNGRITKLEAIRRACLKNQMTFFPGSGVSKFTNRAPLPIINRYTPPEMYDEVRRMQEAASRAAQASFAPKPAKQPKRSRHDERGQAPSRAGPSGVGTARHGSASAAGNARPRPQAGAGRADARLGGPRPGGAVQAPAGPMRRRDPGVGSAVASSSSAPPPREAHHDRRPAGRFPIPGGYQRPPNRRERELFGGQEEESEYEYDSFCEEDPDSNDEDMVSDARLADERYVKRHQSSIIQKLMGRGRKRSHRDASGESDMEASVSDLRREEARSVRLGRAEDVKEEEKLVEHARQKRVRTGRLPTDDDDE